MTPALFARSAESRGFRQGARSLSVRTHCASPRHTTQRALRPRQPPTPAPASHRCRRRKSERATPTTDSSTRTTAPNWNSAENQRTGPVRTIRNTTLGCVPRPWGGRKTHPKVAYNVMEVAEAPYGRGTPPGATTVMRLIRPWPHCSVSAVCAVASADTSRSGV